MTIVGISLGTEDYGRLFGLRLTVLGQGIFLGCTDRHWLSVQLAGTYPALGPLRFERISRTWHFFPASWS